MNLKKIKAISWYRQQTEGTPYFIVWPCRGCLTWFKDKERIAWFCNLEEARAYLDKDLIRQLAEEYLEKEKQHPGNLQELFADWIKDIREINEGLFGLIDTKGLHTLSDQELLAINKKLAEQTFMMWQKFFMDIYDVDAEGLIERELVNAGVNLTTEEKSVLMLQVSPLAHQREERDLLKIVKYIKATMGASNTFLYISSPGNLHRLKLYPEIEKLLEKHQKDYFWIRNSWAHTNMVSIYDFVEVVKQILFSSRNIENELEKLENFVEDLKNEKKQIADKYKLSAWLREMFDFFGLLALWRDERKVEMQKLNHYLELVGREIGKRSGLDWNEVKVCDPMLIKGIPVSRELLRQQSDFFRNNYILHWNGDKVVESSKEESISVERAIESTIQTEVTEIRGMIACPGKVKGEVIVINKKEEFEKMKEGMILVTNMTRPEFVPLMKKAAAIVTDEGGITSHAAVVSRELKVPCIIGTQIATKMLKDGDKVFVNADHGVVIVQE